MKSNTSEGLLAGSSPTPAPVPAPRLRPAMTAVIVAAALLIGWTQPVGAQTSSEPSDPTPATCVSLTNATKLTTTGGPFSGGTKITWNVTAPDTSICSTLVVTMNGAAVARSGSMTVDPLATSSYVFGAKMGTATKTLGTVFAVGGDIIGYRVTRTARGGSIAFSEMNPTTPAAAAARLIAANMTGALSSDAKARMAGRIVEIHVIPAGSPLTLLPPWQGKGNVMTCEAVLEDGSPNEACVDPRPWREVRGVGGHQIEGTNRIAMAAGEETLVDIPGKTTSATLGHTLAHEFGHTVLDFGAPNEKTNVANVLNANPAGHDYVGYDAYTKSTPAEYFAEGAAALFGYEYAFQYRNEYTKAWLQANEPNLFPILTRVFPGA